MPVGLPHTRPPPVGLRTGGSGILIAENAWPPTRRLLQELSRALSEKFLATLIGLCAARGTSFGPLAAGPWTCVANTLLGRDGAVLAEPAKPLGSPSPAAAARSVSIGLLVRAGMVGGGWRTWRGSGALGAGTRQAAQGSGCRHRLRGRLHAATGPGHAAPSACAARRFRHCSRTRPTRS